MKIPNTILFIFIAIFLFSSEIIAQNQIRIDSLFNRLTTAKSKEKLNIYLGLGEEYQAFQPERAIEYAEQALALGQELKSDQEVASALRIIGASYLNKLDYTRARKYLYLALPIEERVNNPKGMAACLMDIGAVYKLRGDYKQAIDKYKRALGVYEKAGIKSGSVSALSNMADVYYKLAKYKTAMRFAMKSLSLSQELNTDTGITEASLILSEAFARVGNYYEAYNYYLLHISTKDSLFNIKKAKEIRYIEQKFERERKEVAEKIKRERNAEIAKRQRIRRDNIQYLLIFTFFIMLFISIYVFGKFDFSHRFVESMIFISVLLLFRFFLIILMPFTEEYSEGAPIFTLLANVVLALLFMPFHKFLESKLKQKVIKHEEEEEEEVQSNSWAARLNKRLRVFFRQFSKRAKASVTKPQKENKKENVLH